MTEHTEKLVYGKDRLLQRDLRLLRWLHRRLIRERCGEGLWAHLVHLKELTGQWREGNCESGTDVEKLLAGLETSELVTLTRAIGTRFNLSNIAEDRHRVRILGQREDRGTEKETIQHAVAELRANMPKEDFLALIRTFKIEPVFTAHPTEAKRRTIRRILARMRDDLYGLDKTHLLKSERRALLDKMRAGLLTLWSTETVSPRKPTVMEELDRAIYSVRTLWRAAPIIVERLRASCVSDEERSALSRPLQFGNWIGGDRDGNPFVTCETTHATLERLRSEAIHLHRSTCASLKENLTVATDSTDWPESLIMAIEQARIRWPALEEHVAPLHPNEWLVQWLTIMDRRLKHSQTLPHQGMHPMAYPDADALRVDIDRIIDALNHAGFAELATGELLNWRHRVDIFGLHLLRLDIRSNSKTIRSAVDQILRETDQAGSFMDMNEAERCTALHNADSLLARSISAERLGSNEADILDTLTLLQRAGRSGDMAALGWFIISMTQSASDVLAAVWLMKVAAHRAGFEEPVDIPVSPLFETIDDLKACPGILSALLESDLFSSYVKPGGYEIVSMLGYSDSAKDGGYLASNWALYTAQRNLAEETAKHDAHLTLFHGRGGAIGRGGGPAGRAIRSLPRESLNGRLRLTEQGEVISARYDDESIAIRHLQQIMWATLIQGVPHEDRMPAETEALAGRMAESSMQAYRALIETPGFDEILTECTVLSLIEQLQIGSRPSRRKKNSSLDDLRAIPFTFAWTQLRMPINAFYGLGSAYRDLDEADQQRVADLYDTWPWFRAVIDNAELALAQCNIDIALRYLQRAEDQEKAKPFLEKLEDEFSASLQAVLAIKRQKRLVEKIPWLHRIIDSRSVYLDILNMIQLELLNRRSAASTTNPTDELAEALRRNVQAIASGLRTTG